MSAIDRTHPLPGIAGPQQLRAHLQHCRNLAGPRHRLNCMLEMMVDAVAPRLVTTTAVLLVLGAAVTALV
jgi:hypothetical protein